MELQLVFQLMDNTSRLTAAATCRRMMNERAHSWKYAELAQVDRKKNDQVARKEIDCTNFTSATPICFLKLMLPLHDAEQFVFQTVRAII